MGSSKSSGRDEGSKRSSVQARLRRQGRPNLESLENRRLLSGGTSAPTWKPTSTDPYNVQSGPLANLGQDLIQVYHDYVNFEAAGGKGTFKSSESGRLFITGNRVGVDVRGYGDFTGFDQNLWALGMQVQVVDQAHKIAEGSIPIAALPQLAALKAGTIYQTVSAQPIFRPITSQQGISPNEGDSTLNAPAARTTFGVDGTGQKVGVLSDSVNQFGGGLPSSVATGDLPPNVQVLQDGAAGSSDEGRAMLEQIHDIAPGAQLAFATAFTGEVGFASNIESLYAAGAKTIVDDVTYFDEPYYQDGIVSQAVNQVVGLGATYLSSAANISDSGYESQFRGVDATVGTLGAGRYMNFDPTGATTATQLGISVYSPTNFFFQFDQPYYTTNGVTSNVEFDVLDSKGALVASGNSNTIATQTPFQVLPVTLPVGLFTVVVKVDAGPDPGHIFLYGEETNGSGGFSVDHKYGSAGQTFYPTTHGHNAAPNTISVGAVPFWGAQPYTNPAFVANEPYSSFGPELQVFDASGNSIAPTVYLKPDISGPDGNNTSFFSPGGGINTTIPFDTANPPYPGESPTTFSAPTTTTNQSVATLPNFFGTSSAAPNVAAVVALMDQANPGITRNQILNALQTTATPLNGAAKGTWNAQGGFGLANAAAALNAAAQLKVVFISPGAGQTVTTAPTFLQVQFNQPVSLASIAANALQVIGPNGATVTVGAPVGFDDPVNPTFVRFPITIHPVPGVVANGTYTTLFNAGTVTSKNGKALTQGVADKFTISQVNGPQISNVTLSNNRIINVTFSEPLNPATINSSTLFLFRAGGAGNPLFNPSDVIVSQLPGAKFSYNASTFTATIDLSGVDQSQLPTDHYGIYGDNVITDSIGNKLNGNFNGVFPSGTTPPFGAPFVDDLGTVVLTAPRVTYLQLAPQSDTGIVGDGNTNVNTPSFVGQVTTSFPGTVSNLLVYAEFNGISHPGVGRGGLDLAVGARGRGFVGHFDVQTITDANGRFVINYPPGVAPLPEGQNQLRVIVVANPDIPPFAGISSSQNTSFRIDKTLPFVGTIDGTPATSIRENATINALPSLSVSIVDPVNPTTLGDPFAVDPKLAISALDPTQVNTTSNYRLFRVVNGTTVDESSFISTATFTSTSTRTLSSDPLTGKINLTFAPGLPTGQYEFIIISSAFPPSGTSGISDAAGNPFAGYPDRSAIGQASNFVLDFSLQPTPTYITNYQAFSPDGAVTDVRANYEIPVPGVTPRAPAPPTIFAMDFSNNLPAGVDYSNDVQLYRSANSATAKPDGDFGDFGITNTTGYTRVTGISVRLANSVPGALPGQYGYNNRLVISLPAGASLPADYYRIYLPNNGPTAITDIYGSQLDGEFKGYKDSSGSYLDLLPNGQVRGNPALPDLSGDGTPGGAFVSGFVVVPNGNIIYARADAIYDPQVASQSPTGAIDRPYPVLAPEAVANSINGGDLNSSANSGANFVNSPYDRSGDGQFEPSAFFAAQQRVQITGGPAVILAVPSLPSFDPTLGALAQKAFVLQAPSGSDPVKNDGSAAVPALTTLVFEPGSILKMQNAALLIQNQGSALQILGGPNPGQGVTITSYKDSTVGGVSNNNPTTVGSPGDYGGILLRNFSQAAIPGSSTPRSTLFPGQTATTGNPLVDQRLKGPFTDPTNPASQTDAVSGADDVMSSINFLTERYAGGAVPQTLGFRYDGITLVNSRPEVTNSTIALAGGAGSAQAGLSVNVDALRSDDIAQGPLIRNDQFINNGLNGIYVRAEVSSGVAEATNAVFRPANSTTQGGTANYVFNNPYPYLLTSKLAVGQQLSVDSGSQAGTTDRLYITPGMLVKFGGGAWIEVGVRQTFFGGGTQGPAASLVVGDPTYANEYDKNHLIGPTFASTLPNAGQVDPSFKANSSTLAQAVFTSFNDNAATTSYFDPITQITSTIVQALPALPSSATTLAPAKGDWGGIQLDAGSRDTINSAIFRNGGGLINTAQTTIRLHVIDINPGDDVGSYVSITNNQFLNNFDVPISMAPNALLATDPTRPLNSGAPFIHGNIFAGNDYNAVGIVGGTTGFNNPNLIVNSVWAGSDFTYLLRDTIVLGPRAGSVGSFASLPFNAQTTLLPEPKPNVVLTLQSTLPGTILADGTTIAAPGVPLVIKLQNPILANGQPDPTLQPPPPSGATKPAASAKASYQEGAGFVVGIDNGIDPTADALVDPGSFSQIRIVGIGANQTTGQSRVPVVITSVHDNTVGTNVNGVQLNQVITGDTTAPKPGDGGVIYFGANMLTDYNLLDPRDGSVIDNADLRYLTRIEHQGGGLVYGFDTTNSNAFVANYESLFGLPLNGNLNFIDQYNQAKQLTVSNSNLSGFSDIGFYAHPGYGSIIIPVNYVAPTTFFARNTGFVGEPTHDFFVNDTFSNMPTAVEILSDSGADAAEVSPTTGPYIAPAEAVFLNNTFYNTPSPVPNGVAIHTVAPVGNGSNFYSHVALLALDNIFSGFATAVQTDGQTYGGLQNEGQNNVLIITPGQLQYNLFNSDTNIVGGSVPIPIGPVFTGSPAFRDPSTGNFFLLSNSDAIDRARSEIGPTIFGDMLYPAVTVDPNNLAATSIRNEPVRSGGVGNFGGALDQSKPAGDINFSGGLGYLGLSGVGTPDDVPYYVDIVTLPGEPVSERGFYDQWIPVTQSSGLGTIGTAGDQATYAYRPITGERDQAGNLRVKDPNSPNIGSGSRPVFDLGAFEYIIQNPPVVTSVQAVSGASASNLYVAGGIAGTNKTPSAITVGFNERIDPTTISGMSVILLASGGDGIFGNANSPADRAINLSGLLAFDPNTNTLTINTSTILANPATLNDEYRLILKGTGSAVIRDPSGLALDGFTNNQTLPLPSGSDNFPGSDFQVTFTISTHSPSIVNGSFRLAPSSDTSGGQNITKQNLPTFVGTITDVFPPVNAVSGQSVHIDISSKGDGVFDLIDAGVGTTNASGAFSITLTKPIPDTPNTIGAGGIKGASGATYAIARVRVINQAGNPSNLPTDPLPVYQAEGATTNFEVDTKLPVITSFSPLANTVATVNANGSVTVSVTFNENIKGSTLNANSIQAFRTGGTGNFQGALIAVPINAGSFTTKYLNDATGSEQVTFTLVGPLPNDQYEIILKGTGANPVTDIAGNPLSGAFGGTFPTGGGSNLPSDFVNLPVNVFTPSAAHLIYVQAGATAVGATGSRANPFATIGAGMAKALIGDDVLVLPGTYKEDVAVKVGVRLLSADPSSTSTTYLPGDPKATLIYGVPFKSGTGTSTSNIITVYIQGGIVGIPTEVSGFSIISPLVGDPSLGSIDPTNTAISELNSNVLIDRNFILNGGVGVRMASSGANALTGQLFDNLIVGNIVGVGITDSGGAANVAPFQVVNNTISDNTYGLVNDSVTPGKLQAFVLNDIFYANHSLSSVASQRVGTGIASNSANTLFVGFDLFYTNGANAASPADDATGTFSVFNPAALSAVPDAQHNFYGDPAFISASDPRPDADTPAVFFYQENYDLFPRSVAINAAGGAFAPATDILYRTPVTIAGKGFPGTGPASIGAYYYKGTGGPVFGGGSGPGSGGNPLPPIGSGGFNNPINPISVTNAITPTVTSTPATTPAASPTVTSQAIAAPARLSVIATSLSPNGTALASTIPGVVASEAAPSFIDIDFSGTLDPTAVSPNDLVLSGTGLDPLNPARATSLTWIDDHAVRFFLSGNFQNNGTVNVSIPPGVLSDSHGTPVTGYSDAFIVASGGTPTLPVQPVAVAGPVAAATAVAARTTTHQVVKAAHAVKNSTQHAAPRVVHHATTPKPTPKPAPRPAHKAAHVATPKVKKGK